MSVQVSLDMFCWGHFGKMAGAEVSVGLGSQSMLHWGRLGRTARAGEYCAGAALAGWLDMEEVWDGSVRGHDLPLLSWQDG